MQLEEFASQVTDFGAMSPRESILAFAWYLHRQAGKERFGNDEIRACYRSLHLASPDVSVYLPRMLTGKSPELLKDRGGYYLGRAARLALDSKYGEHQSVVQISALLSNLPQRLPDLAERIFLSEAISCYRAKAYRATIVMAWNLAFDHLERWIVGDTTRLAAFNSAIAKRFPKKTGIVISSVDTFSELKEAELIDICQTASLVSKNTAEVLREKLKRRNAAAHPSQLTISQAQADDTITDLVNNVVLALI